MKYKILRWQNKKDGIVQSDFCPSLRASGGTDIRKQPLILINEHIHDTIRQGRDTYNESGGGVIL